MRFEYKYLVPNYMLGEFRTRLRPYMTLDPYAEERGGYTVRSIYFDSPNLTCYHEKDDGIKERKKLRIRGYNEGGPDSNVFLEIKRKSNIMISKDRALLAYEDLAPLFENGAGDDVYLDKRSVEDARKFFFHFHRQSMLPVECVIYEREPYVCKFGTSLRITFDMNLRSTCYPSLDDLYCEDEVVPALPDHTILEVKSDRGRGFPGWVRRWLAEYDLKKQALSKYCICLDTHDVVQHGRKNLLTSARLLSAAA